MTQQTHDPAGPQLRDPGQVDNTVACKRCGAPALVKFGRSKNLVQRFRCRLCGFAFQATDAPPRMRHSIDVIASALDYYFQGDSLSEVRARLLHRHRANPDISNIHRWVTKYVNRAVQYDSIEQPKVGRNWSICQLEMDFERTKPDFTDRGATWSWDVLDDETEFLVATLHTRSRNVKDAEMLLRVAARRTGMEPAKITAYRMPSIESAIINSFGTGTAFENRKGAKILNDRRAIREFDLFIRSRNRATRWLTTESGLYRFLKGWSVHYNYFSPLESLKLMTPAEAADLATAPKSWLEVVSKVGPTLAATALS